MDLFPTYFLRGKWWSMTVEPNPFWCLNLLRVSCFFNAMWQWTWTQHFGATKIWHQSCTKPHIYIYIYSRKTLCLIATVIDVHDWESLFIFPLIAYLWVLMVATSGRWAHSSIENIAMWSFPHPLPIVLDNPLKKREKKFMDIRFTRIV